MKFYYSGLLVKNKNLYHHPKRVDNLQSGKGKDRVYKWTKANRRIVRSRASYLAFMGKINYFVTLTMVEEIDSNKVITRFIDNLKKRGYVESFIWVKERGGKSGRLHYHLLFNTNHNLWGTNKRISKDAYVVNTAIFADAWNSAQVGLGGGSSNNCFRLGRSPYIKSPERVGAYITKYITKELGEFDSRMYGCSYDLKDSERFVNNDKENTFDFRPYRVVENDYVVNEYYSLNLEVIKRAQELGSIHEVLASRCLE